MVLVGRMGRLKRGIARAASLLGAVVFGTWAGVKGAVALIGASTVGDDFNQLLERLPKWAEWLFSTPWWVPAGLATSLTFFLIWLSWPREVIAPAHSAIIPLAPSTPTTHSEATGPISLLKAKFADERVRLIDLYVSSSPRREGVAMSNVEVVGPGLFLFGEGCHTFGLVFDNCNFVIVDRTKMIAGAVLFRASQFHNCRFSEITICANADQFADIQRQSPHLVFNVISERPPLAPPRYLAKAYIDPNPGHESNVPEYHAIPACDGQQAVIFLEFEMYLNSPGEHRWTKRKKILLAEYGKFYAGLWEIIRVPIMWKYESGDGLTAWYWGRKEQGRHSDFHICELPFRCRIIFKGPEGVSESTYFTVLNKGNRSLPTITDYYWNFGFKDEWEADDVNLS